MSNDAHSDNLFDDLTGIRKPSCRVTDTLDALEDTHRKKGASVPDQFNDLPTPPPNQPTPNNPTPPPAPQRRPTLQDTANNDTSNDTLITDQPFIDPDFCPHCSASRRPDEPYCYNCGQPLGHQDIRFCRYCNTPTVPGANYCYYCGRSTAPVPEMRLHYPDNNQTFEIIGTKDVHTVGRAVAEQNHYVDIDLGTLGQRRISRHHARFFLKDDEWFLEDLGSKGGTRVYNNRLQPNIPIRMEQGMVVYFADLKFTVDLS